MPEHEQVLPYAISAMLFLSPVEQYDGSASGRTDSTVHAKGQVIHFDTPLSLEEWQWINALNTMLPDDIVIRQVEKKTEEFHARYGVEKKEYRYRVLLSKTADVFRRNYVYKNPLPTKRKIISSFCSINSIS